MPWICLQQVRPIVFIWQEKFLTQELIIKHFSSVGGLVNDHQEAWKHFTLNISPGKPIWEKSQKRDYSFLWKNPTKPSKLCWEELDQFNFPLVTRYGKWLCWASITFPQWHRWNKSHYVWSSSTDSTVSNWIVRDGNLNRTLVTHPLLLPQLSIPQRTNQYSIRK